MSDDRLRPETARPRIPPRPGGFAAAVRGSQARRRRRAATLIGTSATAVVLVLAGLTNTGGSPDTLRPVEPATNLTRPTASGRPASLGPALSGSPAAAGSTPVPGVGAEPTSTAPPSTGRPAVRPATPSPSPRATRPATASAMSRRVVPFDAGDCDHASVDGDSQWCQRYSGPDRARVGVPVSLSTELCRIGRSAGTATFDTTREADFHIYSRGESAKTQWRWSTGRVFAPRGSTISVEPGTCLRWTTTWTTRTDQGSPIAPGTYTLREEVTAKWQGRGVKVSRERAFTVEG